ncbi:MAG: hypothetical protein GWM90_16170, partial [Gemmatimonadetes bacterium]|nr:hypothetical protein [Gemmatimonadota bacterium]NIQ55790.1 hypothetical protein [Gemmatimonadota bacterium]NIU76000.1 hypothetical protein [Gammaproteobacteria bacterium]NIX45579.1 hypothetical protein [Gemmatimonadota bacterium]NIY09864.1 hypothetical protein [Gemmatimonadota bacterium]
AIREQVTEEVEAARESALASDMPASASAIGDVYDGDPGWIPWTRRDPYDPHEA